MGQCITHTNTILGFPSEQEVIEAKCRAAQTKLYEGITLLTQMERQMDTELEYIQKEVRNRNSRGDKSGAMSAFKSMKLKEKERDRKRQMRTTLESQYNAIQTSQFSGELHKVLSECNGVLRSITGTANIDAVQNTMDDLDEIFKETKEIADVMAEPIGESLEEQAELELEGSGDGGGALEKQLDMFLNSEPIGASTPSPYNESSYITNAPPAPITDPFKEQLFDGDHSSGSVMRQYPPPSRAYKKNHYISGKKVIPTKPFIRPPHIYTRDNRYNPGTTTRNGINTS